MATPGFSPMMHVSTLAKRVVFNDLRPLSPAGPVQYLRNGIQRDGFNWLWGWVAADQSFDLSIGLVGNAGVEGTQKTVAAVLDAVTGFWVAAVEALHLSAAAWDISLTNPGGPMTQIEYWMEMKP